MNRNKSIAIIACDHGFGHTRRCLLVANKLAETGWHVHLFAPKKAVDKLAKTIGLNEKINLTYFSTLTSVEKFRKGNIYNWVMDLPPMDEYSLVVSDNLPEILKVRSDAILSGSFLWHKVVDGIDPSVYEYMENLFKTHKPKMIASSLFASQELYDLTNLYPVGLYAAEPVKHDPAQGDDLLISCGMSGEIEDEYREFVEKISFEETPPFSNVWVEPRLIPESPPGWMKPATYDKEMYKNLVAAIIRPGVGTVTDCLWGGARLFLYCESSNKEMINNAKIIENNCLGMQCFKMIEAYNNAIIYCRNRTMIRRNKKRLERISFYGVYEAVEIYELITHN